MVNGVVRGRTEVINNGGLFTSFSANSSHNVIDLNPVWDEIIYIPGKIELKYSDII